MEHHRRSFRGKNPPGREHYYRFPVSDGVETRHARLEVDNCELSGWSHAAVFLRAGEGHHVHHSFIHHNQYNGLGYGVCHDRAVSLIESNLFDHNRHSVAGTGRPGSGYEARHNVELGVSLSHCFDMHGGRDRKDGTNVAGRWLKIHHNTFRAPQAAIVIRGLPEEKAEVFRNWFSHASANESVRHLGKTEIHDNAFSLTRPRVKGARRPGKWY